jgi:hypothetical protein
VDILKDVLNLFRQIGDIEAHIDSNDDEEFLESYDRLIDAIQFLEKHSEGVGAAEKLERCKGTVVIFYPWLGG